jgi:spore germination protein KB
LEDEKIEIKPFHYMFLVAGFIHGSHLLMAFMDNLTGHDFWIVVISGFVFSLPLVLSFIFLSKKFPDLDLTQILEKVYGKLLGKIITLLYVLFFLLLLSFNLSDIATFYKELVMQDLPIIVFLSVFAVLCAYAVKMGIDGVAKISILTVIFGIFTPVFTSLLLIADMDFSNLMPVLEVSGETYLKSVGIFVVVPFGEAITLLMVTPYVKDKKKISRNTVGGMAIITFIFLVIALRNTVVLGPSNNIYAQSAYQTVRIINVGKFFTRVELLIALVITSALFIKISVIYYATVKSVSRLINLSNYKILIIPIGTIAVVLGSVVFGSTISHSDWGEFYATAFGIPFSVVIPLLTILIAKLRKV